MGGWQAIRLGVVDRERVTEDKRGVAPWFKTVEEMEEDSGDNN